MVTEMVGNLTLPSIMRFRATSKAWPEFLYIYSRNPIELCRVTFQIQHIPRTQHNEWTEAPH